MLATAKQETRASAARHADPADQAAAEYERQSIVHKSNTTCGGDIEPKRLEVIPWARYCVKCQEAREQG